MVKKRCSRCQHRRVRSTGFYRRKGSVDGYDGYCKVCRRELSTVRYHNNPAYRHAVNVGSAESRVRRVAELRRLVSEYLVGHPCIDCGEDNAAVLSFDHMRGRKVANVSTMVQEGWRWSRVEREIAKCEVRCANCHAKRTSRQQAWGSNRIERRRRLRDRINRYKRRRGCRDCGERDPDKLAFDHVRGHKSDWIFRMIGREQSWRVIRREIAKCEVRCHSCHRIRHVNERKRK
jgi:hypothetical protein